jgi:hypothetical protein
MKADKSKFNLKKKKSFLKYLFSLKLMGTKISKCQVKFITNKSITIGYGDKKHCS